RPGSPLGAYAPGASRSRNDPNATEVTPTLEDRGPRRETVRGEPAPGRPPAPLPFPPVPMRRPTIMRMRLGASLLVALAGLFGAAGTAAASHCGAATYS